MMAAFYDNATTDKLEFTKLSDEQSQARLSYAMTMSKSRKSEFTKLSDEQNSAQNRLIIDCAMRRCRTRLMRAEK
jgi:hypothetical protein